MAVSAAAREQAYRRAQAVAEGLGRGRDAGRISRLEFASELFAALAVDLCAHVADLRRLIDRVEAITGIPRIVLGREVLRMPQLVELPTAVAIEVELTLLLVFAHAQSVSLWSLVEGGDLQHIGHAGEVEAEAGETTDLARRLLTGGQDRYGESESASGILVDGPASPTALTVRGGEDSSAARGLLLEADAPNVSTTLARGALFRENGAAHRKATLLERQLSRLRFDLHDGPQQDVIMLAEDLRLFGDQLAGLIENATMRDRMTGRIDDLQARLVALDGDLRRISSTLLSPFLQPEPLPESISQLAEAFTARTHIEPELTMQGELTKLTDSQQIALLALIRESLSNIREHSEAQHVAISVSASRHGVDATVFDDGRGFDPETAMLKAAREGHLGLVGMHERVRLLGGETRIDSRPGGPTVISVSLPSVSSEDGASQ